MKSRLLNIIYVAAAVLTFSSCEKTDGALYSGEPNKLSFFTPSLSVNMTGGSISVPIARTSSSGELSVPLNLTSTGAGYTNVFKLAGPVKFENGQAKSNVVVNYGDFSTIDPSSLSVVASGTDVNVGLAFPITVNIPAENASPSDMKSINVLASNALEFESKGTTELNSVEGWAEEVLTVNIQKAKGANVYKIVNPFGGGSFAFMIKADGKTVVFPNGQVIYKHSTYGDVTMNNVTGTVTDNIVTLNVAGYIVSAGSFGSGKEIIKLPL